MAVAASPSFVDQIRGLMNERAVLLTQRIEIDSQVSLIDAQLAEVRYILGDGAKPMMAAVHVEPAPSAAPTAATTETAQPLRAHDAEGGLQTLTTDKILATVKATGPIAVKALAEKLSVNHWTLRDRLSQLQVNRLIRFVGQGRGRRVTVAGGPAPSPTRPDPAREDAAGVDARDRAVRQRIANNGGVATIQELRRWFLIQAGINGGGRDDEKAEALKNSLLRLKAKAVISRTGDTWSLIGAASV